MKQDKDIAKLLAKETLVIGGEATFADAVVAITESLQPRPVKNIDGIFQEISQFIDLRSSVANVSLEDFLQWAEDQNLCVEIFVDGSTEIRQERVSAEPNLATDFLEIGFGRSLRNALEVAYLVLLAEHQTK